MYCVYSCRSRVVDVLLMYFTKMFAIQLLNTLTLKYDSLIFIRSYKEIFRNYQVIIPILFIYFSMNLKFLSLN